VGWWERSIGDDADALIADPVPAPRSVEGLVRAAKVGIGGWMALQTLELVGLVNVFPVASQQPSGFRWTVGIHAPSVGLTITWAFLALWSGVLTIWSLNRAYRNRAASGLPLPMNPRWYAVSWFIPLVNLFMPYRPTKQIWEGRSSPPQPLLGCWWAAWVVIALRDVAWFDRTHGIAGGWQQLDTSFRAWNAATALLLGALTLQLLSGLVADQRRLARTA
jgi:hypothetical protein